MGGGNRISVTRSSMPGFEEYCQEIHSLWESRWLTNMGIKHRELVAGLERYLDVPSVSLFTNGHSALECTLEMMELGRDGRDEVITTPFTFVSTTHAIVRKGLKPIFCDVRSDDLTIDPAKIEALITPKTCAVVPVHVYGNPCDVYAIQDIADRYGLKVIYDAAHAFGVTVDGVGIGNFGDASMFSFHATKVFNTIEGGAVAYHDSEWRPKLRNWRNFGITGPETCEYVGGNAKMNEFCAAMGLCNLRHVDAEIAKRGIAVTRYRDRLSDIPGIFLPQIRENIRPNHAYFPVFFDPEVFEATRDDVFEALSGRAIGARKYFYPITSALSCYEGLFDPNDTPVAKLASERVLTLPLYADLALEDVDEICDIVLECKRSGGVV